LQQERPGDTQETVVVALHGWHARDLATGRDYGLTQRLVVTLDPVTPGFLELAR
jgi:hypothetical protein